MSEAVFADTGMMFTADDAVWDGITAIADDAAYCAQRGMAVVALGNIRGHRDEAVGRLTALLDDQCVVVFAILGLAKLDAREALPSLLPLLAHDNPVVARVARRTVTGWATVSATSSPAPPRRRGGLPGWPPDGRCFSITA